MTEPVYKRDHGLWMRLYEQGLWDREIAAKVGVPHQYVQKWRKDNGLKSNWNRSIVRFKRNVPDLPDDQCWPWAGYKSTAGYGYLSWEGVQQPAHRVSYMVHKGRIPKGMYVCHQCDNPPCVNPAHLFLGSHEENQRDASTKGRMERGERHHNSKLSRDDVREIRVLIKDGLNNSQIAKRFNVGRATIRSIRVKKTWRWLEEEQE